MWLCYKYYLNETFKQQESMFLCTYTECRWYLWNKIHGKFTNQTNIFPWEALMKNTSDADKFRLPKKSKSKVLFYTSNTGNRRTACSVSFKYWNSLIIGTRDVFSKTPYVIFDVIGKLKWVEEWREVFYGALLLDNRNSIKITVWRELVHEVLEDVTIEFVPVKLDFRYRLRYSTLPPILKSIRQIKK